MNKFQFLYPVNGLLIFVAVGIILLYVLGRNKRRAILKVFKLTYRQRLFILRIVGMSLGLLLIVIAFMGPVVETGTTQVNSNGLDIYVLMDTSKSMLTEDMLPSRIEHARSVVETLLDKLDGDRIGFIPFSSTAYIQMPLTDDYALAKMFISVMDTEMISGGGTDLSKAISLAGKSFEASIKADKVILLISDGEELTSDATKTIETLKAQNIKVYAMGVGTAEGGLIPEYETSTGEKTGYKKDEKGETVMSKLNETVLKKLADGTGGRYYQASDTMQEIDTFLQDISGLSRDTLKTEQIKEYRHLYPYFLACGLILFLLGFIYPERRLDHA